MVRDDSCVFGIPRRSHTGGSTERIDSKSRIVGDENISSCIVAIVFRLQARILFEGSSSFFRRIHCLDSRQGKTFPTILPEPQLGSLQVSLVWSSPRRGG